MAYTRRQPSGSWQGVATHPNGKRHTKTFALKRQAALWASEQEDLWRRGVDHDPRAGEQLVGQWLDEWLAVRRVDPVTADKESSQLRNHIRPRWADWPLASVRRMDVQAWVREMETAGTNPQTIVPVVRLFSTALRAAVEENRLAANPAARIAVPRIPARPPFFWSRGEATLILAEMAAPWSSACELSFHTGLRLGEMLGLRVGAVDWSRGLLHVTGVQTRHGWREHPKSRCSRRAVPIPGHLLDELAPLVLGRPAEAPVFAGRGEAFLSDVNFRNRIWSPALGAAGACPRHRPIASAECEDCTPVPRGTPHDMRHTAASWLVQAGVDLYRVQALLGHESFATTQRYAHLAPDAHDRIKAAWEGLRSEVL